MAERQPLFIITTGKKGLGKTYQNCKLIEEYLTPIPGPTPETSRRARSVLIFDTNGEYTDSQLIKSGFRWRIRTLALKDLPAWVAQSKVEARRILPFREDGTPMTIAEQAECVGIMINQFRGGLIVLEDISRYIGNNVNVDLSGALCSNRHRDQDVLLSQQSASRILPVFFQNVNHIRFHYQNDDCHRFANRIPNSEIMILAQCLTNSVYFTDDGSNNKKRFFVWISYDDEKIRGAFSRRMFRNACQEYLKKYDSKSVAQEALLFKGDKNAHEKAVEACILNLFKYFGN